jgi:putative protein kinase ArgK-like GTPase of G3E family
MPGYASAYAPAAMPLRGLRRRKPKPPSPEWQVPVRAISALEDKGVTEIWDDVARFRAVLEATGAWVQRRRDQARAALWSEIDVRPIEHFRA